MAVQSTTNKKLDTDVCIVGAGIAGLMVARHLQSASDVSSIVLEADQRVGGRLRNYRFPNGDMVDIGGQWIGPGQDRMYRLVSELGLSTYPLYDEGDHLLWNNGEAQRFSGTIPKVSPLILAQIGFLLWRFETLAKEIDLKKPFLHPKAGKWDRITLAGWAKSIAKSEAAYELFRIGVGAVFAAEPEDLSLLHALFYARSGNSFDTLLKVTGGAQQDRIHGGTARICEKLAAGLERSLMLGQPVTSVKHTATGVTVHSSGLQVTAKKLVIAIPPNQRLRILFTPALPSYMDQYWQHTPAGSCIKTVTQYKSPFWRDLGLSGQSVRLRDDVSVSFDNTEAGKSAGLLMSFITGEAARRLSQHSPEDRKKTVIASHRRLFGEEATEVVAYTDQDWSAEPWIRGCYAASCPPGVWTTWGHLQQQSHGPLYFAGTETASEWHGYMEGAVESAERVSAEVLAVLRHPPQSMQPPSN